MTRSAIAAAFLLATTVSAPVICETTSSAFAQEGRGNDGGMDLRDILRDRIRTREDLRDLIVDLLRDRTELRGRLRERMSNWRDREEDEEDEEDEVGRGGLRERFAERMAGRRRGGEEGECYFLTRSLRDADRDFLVIVRRRICPD